MPEGSPPAGRPAGRPWWDDLVVLTDAAIVAALRAARPLSYSVTQIDAADGVMTMLISQAGSQAHLRIALPSTRAPQWWLHAPAEDAEDWVGQLLTWIDEEVDTDGLGESRARTMIDGVSHVVAESYGWRLTDPVEHARLSALAGPLGWRDADEPALPVAVPAVRELVVDGEHFRISVEGAAHQVTWLTGPNAGYGYSGMLAGTSGMSPESIEAVIAVAMGDDERLRRDIRAFLAEIDPATGFLSEVD